jgi:hypothetical protein
MDGEVTSIPREEFRLHWNLHIPCYTGISSPLVHRKSNSYPRRTDIPPVDCALPQAQTRAGPQHTQEHIV